MELATAHRCAKAAARFILANRNGLAKPGDAEAWAEAIRQEVLNAGA